MFGIFKRFRRSEPDTIVEVPEEHPIPSSRFDAYQPPVAILPISGTVGRFMFNGAMLGTISTCKCDGWQYDYSYDLKKDIKTISLMSCTTCLKFKVGISNTEKDHERVA